MNVAIPLIPKYHDLIQFIYRKKFSFRQIVLHMSRKTFSHFSLCQLSKIGGKILTRENYVKICTIKLCLKTINIK